MLCMSRSENQIAPSEFSFMLGNIRKSIGSVRQSRMHLNDGQWLKTIAGCLHRGPSCRRLTLGAHALLWILPQRGRGGGWGKGKMFPLEEHRQEGLNPIPNWNQIDQLDVPAIVHQKEEFTTDLQVCCNQTILWLKHQSDSRQEQIL